MDEAPNKVNYDARLEYYKVLKELLLRAKLARMNGDLPGGYQGLRSVFSMVLAYISAEERESIRAQFIAIRPKVVGLNNIQKGYRAHMGTKIDDELTKIEDNIHVAARAIFLPVGGVDLKEVDWEAIRKRGQT